MAQALAITSMWTFGRGAERIVIRCPERSRIVISAENNLTRQIDFHDPDDRVAYQSALETELIGDGWSLLSFTTSGEPLRAGRTAPSQSSREDRRKSHVPLG